jgi:voltage-gated potassium channel
MTIITISIIGFKEVHTLSERGMWFTAFLIIFSFGIFAFVVSNFTRYLVSGVFMQNYRLRQLKRKLTIYKDMW